MPQTARVRAQFHTFRTRGQILNRLFASQQQGRTQHLVDTGLPAVPCGTQRGQHVCIKADADGFF